MAASIIERPYEISFSRNPVRYALSTNTALTTAGLKIQVRLNFQKFSGVFFETIITLSLTPDSNGHVYVDFSKILDSLVNYQLPEIGLNTPSEAFDQVAKFYIDYREVTTAAPNPSWTSDSANLRYVNKGGLPYQLWQGGNYFINYASDTKPPLTWQKSGRSIGPTENHWLTYLHMGAATTDGKAVVQIVYTDGTYSSLINLLFPGSTVPKYGIYRIPVGVTQLGLADINPAKTIHYYKVWIQADGVDMKAAYEFYVDYRNNYNSAQFNFFNSLGGFDSVRIRGEIEREARYETEIAETTPEAGYYAENDLPPQQFAAQVLEDVVFKGSVGLTDDHYEIDVLRDFRISKGVYEAKYGRWWTVTLLNGSVNLGSVQDAVKDFPVEWTYGILNENYAPDINIGPLPTCPVVTDIIYGSSTLSWTGDPSHVSYIVEIKYYYIGGLPPAIQTIYTTGTSVSVDDLGGLTDVTYRIRAVCAAAYSEWI